MSINADIQSRVQQLPVEQQRFFHEQFEQGEGSPKETADELRKGLIDGSADPHFQVATQLLVAALSDSHSEGKFPTEGEARGGYRDEIKRLRETDPESEVANHLENMLVRLSKKEEADQTRAETVTADMKKHQLKVEQTRLDNYEKAYNEMKAQRISELTKWGHMDAEAAEQQFQQIEHASLSASLKRHHGIAA